ncbi:MAG: hypothetical protein AAF385_11520 [Pseudomonadota bacterium]
MTTSPVTHPLVPIAQIECAISKAESALRDVIDLHSQRDVQVRVSKSVRFVSNSSNETLEAILRDPSADLFTASQAQVELEVRKAFSLPVRLMA